MLVPVKVGEVVYRALAEALAAALDAREHETGLHSKRVACHTLVLAKRFSGEAILLGARLFAVTSRNGGSEVRHGIAAARVCGFEIAVHWFGAPEEETCI